MRLCTKNIWREALLIIATALMLCGCEAKVEVNETQQSAIVKFLESSHNPKLIPESQVGNSIDLNPPFYSTVGQFAYRYIPTYYDAGRDSRAEVTPSSKVTITFELYPTTSGAVSKKTLPTATNNPYYQSLLTQEGLNTTYWNFVPLTITLGSGELLSGIEKSLIGCRKGDMVEIYMTCNMAYGDDVIGMIEKNSALLFVCIIDNVEI